MSADIATLIPELQAPAKALHDLAVRAGVGPRITSTLRTTAEQTRLYRRFQAGNSRFPVAPPGTSAHEFGFAFDMVVVGQQNQNDLGQVWESWGGVWGGRASDPIHFEYPGFQGPAQESAGASCSPTGKFLAEAVDFVVSFAPYIGPAELIATLVGFGFPRSKVLQFLKNPVTSVACGSS